MDRRSTCSTPTLISLLGFGQCLLFSSQLKFKDTRLRLYWFYCVYFYLPNIVNPMHIQ